MVFQQEAMVNLQIYYLFILYFNSVENHKKRHSKKMYWPIYAE